MNKNEAVLMGCVMAWVSSSESELDEPAPMGLKVPVIFEYCPAEEATTYTMSPTLRMTELFEMGFRPVASIRWDADSSALGIFVEPGASHDLRSRLDEESAAIFDAVSDQIAMGPPVVKTTH